jgi:CAAX protease family protein
MDSEEITSNLPTKRVPWCLVGLLLLPLIVIAFQRALGFHGIQSSLYKMCLIIPPIMYCRAQRVSIRHDILRFERWRNCLGLASCLGLTACLVFWVAYLMLGGLLLDKQKIIESVSYQFVTRKQTVLYVAPVTIFLNSLLEEFFYRGFAFGQLVRQHRLLGYVLPAAVFTIQHVLFFWQWMDWVPFSIAVAGLIIFALGQQGLYELAESIVAPWLVHIFGDIALMGIAIGLLRYQI